jgi:hypothetical protein
MPGRRAGIGQAVEAEGNIVWLSCDLVAGACERACRPLAQKIAGLKLTGDRARNPTRVVGQFESLSRLLDGPYGSGAPSRGFARNTSN